MSGTSPELPDPILAEALKLRQAIADVDLKREHLQQTIAGARAKRRVREPIKLLQAGAVATGLVGAGVALAPSSCGGFSGNS